VPPSRSRALSLACPKPTTIRRQPSPRLREISDAAQRLRARFPPQSSDTEQATDGFSACLKDSICAGLSKPSMLKAAPAFQARRGWEGRREAAVRPPRSGGMTAGRHLRAGRRSISPRWSGTGSAFGRSSNQRLRRGGRAALVPHRHLRLCCTHATPTVPTVQLLDYRYFEAGVRSAWFRGGAGPARPSLSFLDEFCHPTFTQHL